MDASTPLTLDEYLSLPEDTRAEIVDGVLRPMVRPSQLHREVQVNVVNALKAQRPRGVRVAFDEVVKFRSDPPTARIPDVVVYRVGSNASGQRNFTPVADVILAVEVVSEGTRTADRYEKPAEYARHGIPGFWRIELEPSIGVWTYRLVDGVYSDEGRYRLGEIITHPGLDWIAVDVTGLLGDFAPER
jgi:Uma2 family endonuclease